MVFVDKFYYFFRSRRRSQRKAKPLKKTEGLKKKKENFMRDLLYAQVSYTFVSSPLASLELLFFPKMDEIQVEVDAKTFQILYTVLLLLNLDW